MLRGEGLLWIRHKNGVRKWADEPAEAGAQLLWLLYCVSNYTQINALAGRRRELQFFSGESSYRAAE